MAKKIKVTVTLDEDLNELADMKYPNKSGRINELLKIDLNETDEKAKLINKLQENKKEGRILTKKLCDLQKKEDILMGDKENIESVLDWARETYSRRGVLGLNFLEKECKRKKVDFESIRQKLEDEEVALVDFDG